MTREIRFRFFSPSRDLIDIVYRPIFLPTSRQRHKDIKARAPWLYNRTIGEVKTKMLKKMFFVVCCVSSLWFCDATCD